MAINKPAGDNHRNGAVRKNHNLFRPMTVLEQVAPNGEVRLVTQDPEIMKRAERSEETGVEVFPYWSGEEKATVVGAVIAQCRDGESLRFTVWPEVAGAHAI